MIRGEGVGWAYNESTSPAGGERRENAVNTDSQPAKEKKDRGLGIKELSDSGGKEAEKRERIMAHRTRCVAEN